MARCREDSILCAEGNASSGTGADEQERLKGRTHTQNEEEKKRSKATTCKQDCTEIFVRIASILYPADAVKRKKKVEKGNKLRAHDSLAS